MTSWRDSILAQLVPRVSRLTLVADPDALLTEERLVLELHKHGFDLIEFSNPVDFRYAYESRYRVIWDQGRQTELDVVLRLSDSKFDVLPYDLLSSSKRLTFGLGNLFPHFSYPILQALDRNLLDTLFDAQARISPDRMGNNATKDFILRHIFGLAAELIITDVDLLRSLLRLHYRGTLLPTILCARIKQVLQIRDPFRTWPLGAIIPDEAAFYAFLQERWPLFLRNHGCFGLRDEELGHGFAYPGPDHLPFDHHDIRIYIDNLFVEGKLTPVRLVEHVSQPPAWMHCGIVTDADDNNQSRIARLLRLIDAERPSETSRHIEWTVFAQRWAELGALVHCSQGLEIKNRFQQTGVEINETFERWLNVHYAGLINLPPNNPVMVHHVARHLARELEQSRDSRTALIVVDGLSIDQWITVRRCIQEHDQTLLMRESAIFAWIPTLTSISRQAIFSGKPPLYFPASIYSTHAEGKLWRRFWKDAGIAKGEIAYQRSLRDMPTSGDIDETLDSILASPKIKIVGLVVDKVDKIMHGMHLGASGMHNQIAQWCQGGFLGALIGRLLDRGFDVWLTSDHGNIECRGKGRPSEGATAEVRGERVRIYPTPELRDQTAKALEFARRWHPVGLPPDTFPLIAQGNDAFGTPGEMIVGHGGITVEEVIVPLVKFERREA